MLFQTVVISFLVMLLVVAGMAVGVIVSGRRITGSCGGLSAIPGVERCDICGRSMEDGSLADCDRRGPDSRD